MSVRSALATILRFVAAVVGLYLVVALGLLLLVVAGRTAGGRYPIPDGTGESVADLALLVATLLGAWFLVEERSLTRLFAFALSVWTLFVLPVLVLAGVDAVVGPLPLDATGIGTYVSLVGVLAYLGAYRFAYPASFAAQKEKLGLGT